MKHFQSVYYSIAIVSFLLFPMIASATQPYFPPTMIFIQILIWFIYFPSLLLTPIIIGVLFHRKFLSAFHLIIFAALFLTAIVDYIIEYPHYFDDDPYVVILMMVSLFGFLSTIGSLIAQRISKLENVRRRFHSLPLFVKIILAIGIYALQIPSFFVMWGLTELPNVDIDEPLVLLAAGVFWVIIITLFLFVLIKNLERTKELVYKKNDYLYITATILLFVVTLIYGFFDFL